VVSVWLLPAARARALRGERRESEGREEDDEALELALPARRACSCCWSIILKRDGD
jgi:hypothetical protein